MRRTPTTLLIVIAALVLVLTPACALTNLLAREAPQPEATPSRTPKPTFTPTTEVVVEPVVAPTLTPTPEPAPTDTPAEPPPTDTPEAPPTPEAPTDTPTPELARLVITNPVLNVRSGPGTNYSILGQVNNGDRYDITGKNAQGSWWQIDFNGRNGWVSGSFVRTEGAADAVAIAQNIPAPPPPPPTSTPRPTQPPAPQPTLAPQFPFLLVDGTVQCRPNAGTTYFDGFVRYRDNSPRNGACVHIAYFGPRNTKCSGCDGVGDGRWGFSPFGGPAPAGTSVEIFVVSCPGPMPSGGQTQETGFGDLTPLSSKWTRTINASEECHGITFVGD